MFRGNREKTVRELFYSHTGSLVHKWDHYLDIYQRHFEKFQGKDVVIVEFGISDGGSLQLWRKFFGRKARIIGVDINPECKQLESKDTEIYIGDQEDKEFLKALVDRIGEVDIVIDDGGHTTKQQITTFEMLYPIVRGGGVYLVEDLHTNYWKEYGGGHLRSSTFVEKAKRLTDQLNAWYSREKKALKVDKFTKSTKSIHFYDSIIVFEKEAIKKPFHIKRGQEVLQSHTPYPSSTQGINPWDSKEAEG